MQEPLNRKDRSRSFQVDYPIATPLVLVPDDTEVNWSSDPLPPPRAKYKRDPEDIMENESAVTSDWNFVLPGY